MSEILTFLAEFFENAWFALADAYGPRAPFYAVIGFTLLLVLGAIPLVLRKKKDPFERFDFKNERLSGDLVKLREDRDDGSFQSSLSEYLQPTNEEELTETKKVLRNAGYSSPGAVRAYHLLRAGLGLGLFLIGVVVTLFVPEQPNLGFGLAISGFLGLLGFAVPRIIITKRSNQRREDIERAFPDAMDMLLVCIEGGQSLDQAMTRVGKEMQISAGPLAHEFGIVSQEFRIGKDRVAVLRDFASRCDVNDVSSFVTVMIQSSAFGTSISDALRVYASEMRDKRLLRAEEKANLLPTKLTLGTMMFTVPPLVLILVGPSFIELVRAFQSFG